MRRSCRSSRRDWDCVWLGFALCQDFQLTLEVCAFFDCDSPGLYIAGHHRRLSHLCTLADLKISLQRPADANVLRANVRVYASFRPNAQTIALKLNTAIYLAIYIDILVARYLSVNRYGLPDASELLGNRCAHSSLREWRESGSWIVNHQAFTWPAALKCFAE